MQGKPLSGVGGGASIRRPHEMAALDRFVHRVLGVVDRRRARDGAYESVAAKASDEAARCVDVDGLVARARGQRVLSARCRLDPAALAENLTLALSAARSCWEDEPTREEGTSAWALLHGVSLVMRPRSSRYRAGTLAGCVAAIAGVPVHLVFPEDKAAADAADAVRPLADLLGLEIGLVARDQRQSERRATYRKDLVFGGCTAMVMDHLRDRLVFGDGERRHRELADRLGGDGGADRLIPRRAFAIADRADVLLCDAAATTVVLSDRPGATEEEDRAFQAMGLASQLEPGRDFSVDEEGVTLTAAGRKRLDMLGHVLGSESGDPAGTGRLVERALTALVFCREGRHYAVESGRVRLLDAAASLVEVDEERPSLVTFLLLREGAAATDGPPRGRMNYRTFFEGYACLSGMAPIARDTTAQLWRDFGIRLYLPAPSGNARRQSTCALFPTGDLTQTALVERAAELVERGASTFVYAGSEETGTSLETAIRAGVSEGDWARLKIRWGPDRDLEGDLDEARHALIADWDTIVLERWWRAAWAVEGEDPAIETFAAADGRILSGSGVMSRVLLAASRRLGAGPWATRWVIRAAQKRVRGMRQREIERMVESEERFRSLLGFVGENAD